MRNETGTERVCIGGVVRGCIFRYLMGFFNHVCMVKLGWSVCMHVCSMSCFIACVARVRFPE